MNIKRLSVKVILNHKVKHLTVTEILNIKN